MKAYATDWRNSIFFLHRLLLEPFILRFARAVFVSTLDYASAVHLRHHNLIEMPFGVDTNLFYPEKAEEKRQELGIPPEMLCILFVGGLDKAHYFKGVDVLLRAAAYLERSMPYRVLIVGDGEERPRFEKMAQDLGISEHVLFLGGIDRDGLINAYRMANVHVLPSLDQGEAFGLVTLEAAASGVPSVVSNLPGMRMLVDPGVTGIRFPAGDARSLSRAIQFFAANRAECEKMGQNARRMAVRHYDEGKVAERMLKAYKECTL
jgi:glycosyltransferase involved in cell wall biosynthesis